MRRIPTNISFTLPEWDKKNFLSFNRGSEKLKVISQRAGKNSDRFAKRCEEFIALTNSRNKSAIRGNIRTSFDVRVFTYILSNHIEFGKNIEINAQLITAIEEIRTPLSRLSLLQFIHAFFNFFDTIFSAEELEVVASFLKLQLSHYKKPLPNGELATYLENSALLFSTEGPSNVVNFASQHQIDLSNAYARLELATLGKGRFTDICNYYYYLETLNKINPGETHDILSEVCKPEVTSARLGDKGLLGHEILKILIDRSGENVSDSWQNTVLSIAGDPRVPETSDNYRRWWAFLDERQIAHVRGWLSKLDLELFLTVLEQSAKDTGKSEMTQMFKPRKQFMEGLLKQGMVIETRLFLSKWAVRHIRRHYRTTELPSFAQVSGTQTSMIYLNLKNKVHMLEGSHSFKLNLFDRLPEGLSFTNYSRQSYSDIQLRSQPYHLYMAEFHNDEGAQQYVHDAYGNWRNKAVNYMTTMDLDVDASELMTREEFRNYRRKYGIY